MKSLAESLITKSNIKNAGAIGKMCLNDNMVFLFIPYDIDEAESMIDEDDYIFKDIVYYVLDLSGLQSLADKTKGLHKKDYFYAIDKNTWKNLDFESFKRLVKEIDKFDFNDKAYDAELNGWFRIPNKDIMKLKK